MSTLPVRLGRYSVTDMTNSTALDHTAWAVTPYPWDDSQRIADALGIPLVAAMVLAGRGLTDPAAARMFLDGSCPLPDPFLFAHMRAAVETLSDAIDSKKRVVVHGDYDADGITATAVLVLGLREFGLEAEWYLPSRFNEGYGLSRTAVETIAAGEPALLITVDCGVNYPDEVRLARERGLDVIVVDHHQPGPVLPDCFVIHEVVGDYPSGDLCGVGLALKLLHALQVQRCGGELDALPRPLHGLLDLVAIGTIGDLAPLRGENRYYVKEGLKLISIGQRVGLRELCSVASCTGAIDSGTVAYRLAPRLNAAGRLADPSPPLRLLLTEDLGEARSIAGQLHELNGERQDVERQILDSAVGQVEALGELPPALVLAGSDWHEGVVGIVASRLVERYHRPTILLGLREGVAKGSGRSIPAYDLVGALDACASFLTIYGGHKQAVGLTLDPENLQDFRAAVEEHARSVLEARDLIATYRADAVIRGEDVNADVAQALATLGPFGTGNPRPRLLIVGGGIDNAETTRTGAHMRCTVEVDGVRARAIGFGLGPVVQTVREGGDAWTLGVQLRLDEWQGTLRPEFLVEKLGPNPAPTDGGCESVPPRSPAAGVGPNGADHTATSGVGGHGGAGLSFARGRDLRGRPGRFTALAQVLATGERALLLTSSATRTLAALQERLPLEALCDGQLRCFGRAGEGENADTPASRVMLAEWEVAEEAFGAVGAGAHVVVLDPPYRAGHAAILRRAAKAGAAVHLYYGEAEKQETMRLLRYVVHPRFAMVCVFRALQEGHDPEADMRARAVELAWQEAQVALGHDDLSRAAAVLAELGCVCGSPGGAKLDVRDSPTYVAAEAEYEECVRLCLTL